MTVGSIIRGGFRLVREQPKAVAIWGIALLVVSGLSTAFLMPFFQEMARDQSALQAAGSVAQPPAVHAQRLAWLFLFDLVLALIYIVLFAAAVRATARIGRDALGYLRFGMDELRLIGLLVILGLAFVLAEVAIVLFLILVGVVLNGALGRGAEMFILFCLGAAGFCAFVFAEVRLSLSPVLTVLRGRIAIGESWRLTKGHFWRLFGAYVVLTLMFAIITLLAVAITNPHLMAAYASFDTRTILAASQEQMARQADHPLAVFLPQILISIVIGTILLAFSTGAITTAALELEVEGAGGPGPDAVEAGPWS